MGASEDVILRLKLQDRMSVVAGLREVARQLELVGKQTDEVAAASGRARVATDAGAKSWLTWGNVAKIATGGGIASGLYNIASAAVTLGERVIGTGVSFNVMKENAQITFGVLLNNGARAKVLVGDLFNLAQRSSFFRYQDVLQAAQSLLTFGFSARQIIPDLKTLANVASLHPERGSAGIEDLAIILGQIRQSGRLLGQDARQLEQLGINPYIAIAKRLQETPALVMQQASQGLISSKVAIDAVFAYANQRYRGLADRLSRTTGGKQSNVLDLLTASAGTFTQPFMASYNRALDRLAATLQKPSTQNAIRSAGQGIVTVTGDISKLVEVTHATQLAFAQFTIGLQAMRQVTLDVRDAFRLFGFVIQSVNHDYLQPFLGGWDWLMHHTRLGMLIDVSVTGPGSSLVRSISRRLGGVGGAVNEYAGLTALALVPGIGPLAASSKGARDFLHKLTGQAEGGRTLDAGWSWVGERGPELAWMPKGAVVQPLDRAAPASSGGMDRLASAVESLASRPIVVKVGERVLFEAWGDELDRRMANR